LVIAVLYSPLPPPGNAESYGIGFDIDRIQIAIPARLAKHAEFARTLPIDRYMVDTLTLRAIGFNATFGDMPLASIPVRFLAFLRAKLALDPFRLGSMARSD